MGFTTNGHWILNVENILKRVSEEDIFKFYIKGYDGSKNKFCSELRTDKNPTCSIKKMESGRYIYKDFGTGDCYTCFDYIQTKYGLDFYSTLRLIADDFKLELNGNEKIKKVSVPLLTNNTASEINSSSIIRIVPVKFTQKGIDYWNEYGINEELLNRYRVKEISHYYLNGKVIAIPKKELCFTYCFGNTEIGRYKYKILRPANANWKWLSNCNSNILQGYDQLHDNGDLLFLTSSLKDVMSLRSIGYMATASQSENTTISEKLIIKLKKRFKKLILFLNNDLPGLRAAEYQSNLYKIPYIYFPLDCPKDPSDYCKLKSKEELLIMIAKLITNVR